MQNRGNFVLSLYMFLMTALMISVAALGAYMLMPACIS